VFYLDLTSEDGTQLERREFGMLNTQKKDLRFALCSCMDDARHEPEIWQDLVERRPDMIFFIGDSVYVDYKDKHVPKNNPFRLWKRFSEARRTLEIYYSKRLIPIFATWDDHDFGKDNSNSESYPHVKLSQKNFLSYFAQEESHCSTLERGPGVSSAFKAGKHLFLLMDDRSYRLDDGNEDRYAHWGQEQEEWALDVIGKHSGVTWLMNGSQIFPQMIYKESMSGGHRNQFIGFMKSIRHLNKKVIFASGDVHFSEISKIESEQLGYPTFEVTSSSMHSRCFPGLQHIALNRRRIVSTTKRNYILVDSSANDQHSIANVYSCSAGEKVNFSRQLKV
ncbi:MAG: alkaline phosphatase D family protein, partial [Bdellovibrio sp.]|nr:alkaline phosphatase D family protein [Bdellovibrio sp.]